MALIPESFDAVNWEDLSPCSVEPINALIAAVRERMIRSDYINKEYSPSFFSRYSYAQSINILRPDELISTAFYRAFITPETAQTKQLQKITDKWILEQFPLAMQRIPPGILTPEIGERLTQIHDAIRKMHYVYVPPYRAGYFKKVLRTITFAQGTTLSEAWQNAVSNIEEKAPYSSEYVFYEDDIKDDSVPCYRRFSASYDSVYSKPFFVSLTVAGFLAENKYIITNLKNIPVKRSWHAQYSGDIIFDFGIPFNEKGVLFPDGIAIPAKTNVEYDGFCSALPPSPPADLTEDLLRSIDGVNVTGRVDIAAVDDLRPGLRYI